MIAVSYDLIDRLQLVCVAMAEYLGFGITWNFFNFFARFLLLHLYYFVCGHGIELVFAS